jgi:hypothetical protein
MGGTRSDRKRRYIKYRRSDLAFQYTRTAGRMAYMVHDQPRAGSQSFAGGEVGEDEERGGRRV